jgi:hypothetical protein
MSEPHVEQKPSSWILTLLRTGPFSFDQLSQGRFL